MNTKNNDVEPDLDSEFPNNFFELRTLDMMTKSKPIQYDELPKAVRADLNSLASNLFDPHGGQSLVIGYPLTGKSFLVEQFAANVDRYLEKTNLDDLLFICLDPTDLAVMESIPGGFDSWMAEIVAETERSEEEICFVTESLEVAQVLTANSSKSKIIFEMSIYLYRQLVNSEMHGNSKTWMSWPSVDVNFTFCTKNELVNLLHDSLSESFAESLKIELPKKNILVFINHCIKQIPQILSPEDEKIIAVPAGLWAYAIRKLATAIAFESDNAQIGKITASVFKDMAPHIQEFVQLRMDREDPFNGMPEELLSQMGITVISSSGSQTASEPEESNKPIASTYSDFETLPERIKKEVIGQDDAVDAIVEGLLVPAAGLNDQDKPIRTMMLLGSTGVGKTKLALTLANELMEDPMNVVRLDMSEYATRNEAIKLFGSPPGYIGHGQGGVLTNAVMQSPRSLILLDEVEKADPMVWDAFLQVFDAGRMTDGSGNVVDFRNTVIVMTSNLGTRQLARKSSGFAAMRTSVETMTPDAVRSSMMREVHEYFKPELVNRIDEFIVFQQLSQETARKILAKEIGLVYKRAELAGFEISEPSTDIIDALLLKSDVTQYGARDIQRTVLKNLSSPIARSMLKKTRSSKGISLTMNENKEISVLEN